MELVIDIDSQNLPDGEEIITRIIRDILRYEKIIVGRLQLDIVSAFIKIVKKYKICAKNEDIWIILISRFVFEHHNNLFFEHLLLDITIDRKKLCYVLNFHSSDDVLRILFSKKLNIEPINRIPFKRKTIINDDFLVEVIKNNFSRVSWAIRSAANILVDDVEIFCRRKTKYLIRKTSNYFMEKWFKRDPSIIYHNFSSDVIIIILTQCKQRIPLAESLQEEPNDESPISLFCRDRHKGIKYLLANGIDPEFHVISSSNAMSFYERLFVCRENNLVNILNIIQRHEINPLETKWRLANEISLGDDNMIRCYIYCVMVSDGYFSSNHSFFKISSQLPTELQMIMVNRLFNRMNIFITSNIKYNLNIVLRDPLIMFSC